MKHKLAEQTKLSMHFEIKLLLIAVPCFFKDLKVILIFLNFQFRLIVEVSHMCNDNK